MLRFLLALSLLIPAAEARPGTAYGGGAGSILVQEEDGDPTVRLRTLIVPNGSITDEGSAVVSIIFQTGPGVFAGVAGTFKTDDLTAQVDGIKTAFTISSGPALGSLSVTLDGIDQRESVDYTIAGNVVSFTTAPAADTASLLFFYFFQADEATSIFDSTNTWSAEQFFSSATIDDLGGDGSRLTDVTSIFDGAQDATIDALRVSTGINGVALQAVGVSTAGLRTDVDLNATEIAALSISTQANFVLATTAPPAVSSLTVGHEILIQTPDFQSISTTAITMSGGRPFFVIISLVIQNSTADRLYEIRILQNGVQEGLTLTHEVEAGADSIISFHIFDVSSTAGLRNFTLELNTSNSNGFQEIIVSRVTAVEL